jgi:hypothetical protein
MSEQSLEHLERALQCDDPSEKDYHIRQVLQASGVGDIQQGLDISPDRVSSEAGK